MRSFTFHPGPRLIAGVGKSQTLSDLLPDGPVLFVSDEQLVGLGLTDAARQSLEDSGRAVTMFDKVEADPSRMTLEAAVEAGRSAGVTSVVGFGGGSPMDVAKLAAYLLGSGDDLDDVWGVDIANGRAPAARPRSDHRGHRLGSDADFGHHLRRRRKAGGERSAADCGLGGARSAS